MGLRLLRKMGLFRKKDKNRRDGSGPSAGADTYLSYGSAARRNESLAPPGGRPARGLLVLPPPVLERIFWRVCPHARDESYEKCEDSSTEDACMLCDTRDLAHCVKVCRAWRVPAQRVLWVFSTTYPEKKLDSGG
jgi:hypothetical protein